MPLVKATENWINGARAVLKTPSGVAHRPPGGVGNYPIGIATWLIDQGFGTAVDPVDPEDRIAPPSRDPSDLNVHGMANRPPDFSDSPPAKIPPVSDETASWEAVVLEFLNRETAEAIAHAVKGIGSVTATDLVESKPLTIETLTNILNKRQMDALESWAGAQPGAEIQ